MPRDGSGVYTLPAGNPVITDTVISSVWANTTLSDIAAQLNNVFTRDGLLGPTGPFKLQDGTIAAPGLAWNSEPGLGWFRKSASVVGFAAQGVQGWAFDLSLPAQAWMGWSPRTNGAAILSLANQPVGSVNYVNTILQQRADGSAILGVYAGGSGAVGQLTLQTGGPSNIKLQPGTGAVEQVGTPHVTFVLTGGVAGNTEVSLRKNGATAANNIWGMQAATPRWLLQLGNEASEAGASAGSDFVINRYSDSGTYLATALLISRANGGTTFNGPVQISNQLAARSATMVPQLVADGQGTFAGQINLMSGGSVKALRVLQSTNTFEIVNAANTAVISELTDFGRYGCTWGYRCKAGQAAGYTNNVFNLWYDGAGATHLYIDAVDFGIINTTSDERIKHRIAPLEANESVFMAIKPIRFHFRDIGLFKDDGVEHWGFSAQNLIAAGANAVSGDVEATLEDGTPQPAHVIDRSVLAQTVVMVQHLVNRVTQLENK